VHLTQWLFSTQVASANHQPGDVAPYRLFGVECRFAPHGVKARPELDAIGVDDAVLDLTINADHHKQGANPNTSFCPWLCAAFPNRARVKCGTREPAKDGRSNVCCL